MKTSIAAIVRSYHNTDFLEDVLKSLDWVDKVLVVNCLHLGYEDAPDDTEEIVNRLNQPNVELLKLTPHREHEVLNISVSYLSLYQKILINDADEFIEHNEQKKLLNLGRYNCGLCQMVEVMPDGSEVPRQHRPVAIVRPDCHFTFQRCIEGDYKIFHNVTMKHYGNCVKDLDWKRRNYTKMKMKEPLTEVN